MRRTAGTIKAMLAVVAVIAAMSATLAGGGYMTFGGYDRGGYEVSALLGHVAFGSYDRGAMSTRPSPATTSSGATTAGAMSSSAGPAAPQAPPCSKCSSIRHSGQYWLWRCRWPVRSGPDS